ncbi:MAG: hypothetical protein IKS21_06290, partial [Oscillospiraceae bacterium]|nr:hypothetical protein [Oscillospiraceae bacterium]
MRVGTRIVNYVGVFQFFELKRENIIVRRYAVLQRYDTLDLPPANCIRSECRTSNARPYGVNWARSARAVIRACRDEHR